MGHGETKVSVLSQNRVPIIICFVVACSAFPFSLLHYFLPQMLRKQFQISVENLGLYTGLVDFADSFSSFISSAFLGYLSDVYGKKYLLIASLFSSFLRLFLYPFVKNIWLLIALECTYGLVNCTSVMVRAILVEFSTENNRVLYFGYLTASYALSRAFRYSIVFYVQKKISCFQFILIQTIYSVHLLEVLWLIFSIEWMLIIHT